MNTLKTLSITALFLLISISGFAQSRKITFTARNLPIKEALAQIQQKSGYRILYNDEVVVDDMLVSVDAKNLSVNDVLMKILAETDLVPVLHSEELIVITRNDLINRTVELSGKISDESGLPIEFANVILYKSTDTNRIEQGSVTDKQGMYKLVNLLPGNYVMKISFVGYETITAEITIDKQSQQMLTRNFQLKTNTQNLETVVVSGERRVLTAEGGKLVFYMPTLLKNKSATNAYEALKEIPGVTEQGERLTLIGTSGTTILINNKKTNMTTEQVMNLLRSISVSRLENVEIMYNTPPQYNIRGAAINVILKKDNEENEQGKWQGEVSGIIAQRAYFVGGGKTNLYYIGKNTTFDALYSYKNYRSKNKETMNAEHELQDEIYSIKQENEGTNYNQSHNVRLALNHTFKNKDNAEISYVGTFDKSRSERTALTNLDNQKYETRTGQNGPSYLHNFKADYDFHFGLKMGAEHTLYDDKTTYHFVNLLDKTETITDKINSGSRQQINRSFFYANQTHKLANNWTINYGGNYSLAKTRNFADAVRNDTVYQSASFNNSQNENIWNVFAGFTKPFSAKFSLQASLAVEHYKAIETSNGKTSQLWNDFAFFPTLNASYTASANHIFQLGLSSDKSYPSYWSLNPTVYHFNAYGVTYGNPHLKPMRIYNTSLTYIYKQKYVIRPYFIYIPDYYVQLPYQSREKLQQEFVEQNYTYLQNVGLMGVVPFNIGKRISSRVVANIVYARERDDEFFDISFDRKTVLGVIQMNNDIVLSTKPNLRMNVSGYVSTPTAIQGIFDLGASGDLSTALTWTFDKDRARLILKAEDIFNTRTPLATIDYKGQKSTLKAYRDTRAMSLSFIYRFGGYQEKERKEVDTSRFGTN